MILRIDPNKILHIQKQTDFYVGENSNDIIQILVHPSILNTDVSSCEATFCYNNKAIKNGHNVLFISNEKKDNFIIFETIVDLAMTAINGQMEVWVEIKTPDITIKTTSAKINIKPSRKSTTYKYTTIEAEDLEDKLLSIRNDCKKYYQMARKESGKAQKCVQIMIDILKEHGGDI